MDKITFIGAGNVAHHLAIAFFNNGFHIQDIYSRSLIKAENLAKKVDGRPINQLSELNRKVDMVLVCVSDDAIQEVTRKLDSVTSPDVLIVHTSGTVSSTVFNGHFSHYGVFYPLQSIRRDRALDFQKVPICITANTHENHEKLMAMARQISEKCRAISDLDRAKLHIPAVTVNNFVNFLYIQAENYCNLEGLSFDLLKPLIEETAQRISDGEAPMEMQTGPAIRGDRKTIKAHLEALSEYPEYRKLYQYLTHKIRHIES